MDAKKEFSPTRSDNNIQGLRNEPERQIDSLRSVIGNIRRDGDTPSAESIATHLSRMHIAQRAHVLSALQRTRRNCMCSGWLLVFRRSLRLDSRRDIYEQEVDRVAEPSRVWDGAIGDQMRTILRLPSGQLVFDLFAGRGRKSDDAELATTISCRKMAVDLSNRFDRCRRACRGYDQRDEPAIRQISGKDHLNSR